MYTGDVAKKRTLYPTAKPYKGFPLTPRADGRFVKRINGNLLTFGRRGEWRVALDEYLAIARAAHAGRPVQASAPTNVTVRQLVNRYLAVRLEDVGSGDLHLRTYADYRSILLTFGRFIGPATPATELGTAHVDRYAAHLRDKVKAGPRRFNAARAHIRAFLRYAFDAGWIVAFPMGVGFKRAGRMREVRKNKLIAPHHLRILIEAAEGQLRAMILLGINCAFGNTDCATLPRSAVDLDAALIRFPRPKTGIPRTVPLWSETVTALREVMRARPTDALVFRTRHGSPWVRTTMGSNGKPVPKDSLAQAFAVLLKSVCSIADKATLRDLYKGVGFYALRVTHRTIGDDARDPHASMRIMGHSFPGMNDVYVQEIGIARLAAVTDYVRAKVLG